MDSIDIMDPFPIEIWVEIVRAEPRLYGAICALSRRHWGALRDQKARFKVLAARPIELPNERCMMLPNGDRHGLSTTYLVDRIWWSIEYVDGVRHGEYKHYYPDGALWWTCTYANGQLHGTQRVYDSDGTTIQSVREYAYGQLVVDSDNKKVES